ncbi:MAG: polyprenyl synthetase family protein [Rickettsiales bacterium]|nr:polyprenyl synthetase family protein [Rickettsiales bacterium]
MKEFSQIFAELADDLKNVDEKILEFSRGKSPLISEITNHLVSSGGKRVRPILHLICAKLCGVSDLSAHYNLAAAIELIHSATLLHDDVVDNSKSRRGKDTANAIWDNKAPILVGDYLFSIAFQLMVRSDDMRVLDLLAKASSIMADGEVMQLENSNDITLSKATYLDIIFGKTAVLFSAACESAALLAKKDEEKIKALREFGKNLGIVFQIVDDILDYSSSSLDMGKEVGDDFFEGKVTLPIIIAYEKSDAEERQLMAQIFIDNYDNSDEKNQDGLDKVMSIMNKYKAIELSKEIANQYYEMALENLQKLTTSGSDPNVLNLQSILYYCMQRIR